MTANSNKSQAFTAVFIYPITQVVTDFRFLLDKIALIQENKTKQKEKVKGVLQFKKERKALSSRASQCQVLSKIH